MLRECDDIFSIISLDSLSESPRYVDGYDDDSLLDSFFHPDSCFCILSKYPFKYEKFDNNAISVCKVILEKPLFTPRFYSKSFKATFNTQGYLLVWREDILYVFSEDGKLVFTSDLSEMMKNISIDNIFTGSGDYVYLISDAKQKMYMFQLQTRFNETLVEKMLKIIPTSSNFKRQRLQ